MPRVLADRYDPPHQPGFVSKEDNRRTMVKKPNGDFVNYRAFDTANKKILELEAQISFMQMENKRLEDSIETRDLIELSLTKAASKEITRRLNIRPGKLIGEA